MNKKYLLALITVIIVAIGIFVHKETNENLPFSAIVKAESGQEIRVRVANSDKERRLGLSGFKSLPQDQGMLFVFDESGVYPFWMKDMNFPIDIIWLKKVKEGEFVVVHTASNVLPESYPQSISPREMADAVLEVNKGVAAVHNLIPEKNLWISFKK